MKSALELTKSTDMVASSITKFNNSTTKLTIILIILNGIIAFNACLVKFSIIVSLIVFILVILIGFGVLYLLNKNILKL